MFELENGLKSSHSVTSDVRLEWFLPYRWLQSSGRVGLNLGRVTSTFTEFFIPPRDRLSRLRFGLMELCGTISDVRKIRADLMSAKGSFADRPLPG